jgi:transposase, IS30 family
VSSISEEISRNSVRGKYDSKKAHHKSYVRRRSAKYQGMKIVGDLKLREFIDHQLYEDRSPEAITGRLNEQEKSLPRTSKDSIYRYIKSPHGRQVEYHREKSKKSRRSKKRGSLKKLSERTFIDKRPVGINKRQYIGDVEADFIVSGKSGKGILLVVVDRKSRVTFIEQVLEIKIQNVHEVFRKIQLKFPELRSITTDNDILFAKHKELEQLLKVKIYFCHPYHSWEKGTVENTNGVIRRYISKGADISKYSKDFIAEVQNKLNSRFMKCLNYQTPQEVLTKHRKRKKR